MNQQIATSNLQTNTNELSTKRRVTLVILSAAKDLNESFRCFRLQADGMPRVKTARWPVNSLPAWSPFAGVMTVRCSVEAQSGNNCKGVTLARVDGDPFASAAFAVAAK